MSAIEIDSNGYGHKQVIDGDIDILIDKAQRLVVQIQEQFPITDYATLPIWHNDKVETHN